VLTLHGGCLSGLLRTLVGAQYGEGCECRTYSIANCVLLLSSNDETLALSSVQGALSLDYCLSGSGTSTVLGSDACDRIPLTHFEGCVVRSVWRI
jgi:hypothetical protein